MSTQPSTADIGIFIKDMIEERPFEIGTNQPEPIGVDYVAVVDVEDPHNPIILTETGVRFRVSIVRID